jgi:hypothetical protein
MFFSVNYHGNIWITMLVPGKLGFGNCSNHGLQGLQVFKIDEAKISPSQIFISKF